MKNFSGNLLFLDRADINTDEIIPARYLTEITKEALRPFLLEDLSLPGFNPARDLGDKAAVVTRANFGCGSSREHAPWALEMNGINVVIAESFARIFKQNMFNCGMLAIELEAAAIARLFAEFAGGATALRTDLAGGTLHFRGEDGKELDLPFHLADFDRALVEAGGWLGYADSRY
jgi:3-isopropylmalate/(R)-2-methylmalate dehydratase small subunit